MDGRDRPQPGDRLGAQEDRSVDRRGVRRARSGSRRYPGPAGEAGDDRGAAAALGLHGPARRGASPPRPFRLLWRLEPGAACGEVPEAGEHHQDLAAARADGNSGVPRVMTDDTDTPEMLAAEYVLGTLASNEREQAQALIENDPAFAQLVRAWEQRLGQLQAMVAPVEPPPETWARIQARVDGTDPNAVMLLPHPDQAARAVAEGNVVQLKHRLSRWRRASAGLAAIAAVLIAFVVT